MQYYAMRCIFTEAMLNHRVSASIFVRNCAQTWGVSQETAVTDLLNSDVEAPKNRLQ